MKVNANAIPRIKSEEDLKGHSLLDFCHAKNPQIG